MIVVVGERIPQILGAPFSLLLPDNHINFLELVVFREDNKRERHPWVQWLEGCLGFRFVEGWGIHSD